MRIRIVCLCLCIGLLALASSALAQSGVYMFPDIEPNYKLYGGYRIIDVSGSDSASEYEYLKNYPSFGGDIEAYPYPNRIHMEFDFLNKNDYSADLSYAYGDMVLSRLTNRTLHHNLDNFEVQAFSGFPVKRSDTSSDDYGIRSSMNYIFLRFKPLEFPFHIYLNSFLGYKKGSNQQRFQGGDGYRSNLERITQKRDIEWNSKDITLGANSHLGPLEVDISHSRKMFDALEGKVMSYQYTDAVDKWSPPFTVINRPAGLYPHNLVPDLEGSSTTLKLHTSYTGRVVGSVTLSSANRENTDSGAKADYFSGAAEIRLTPIKRMSFAFKYRHRQADIDNPDSLEDAYYGLASVPNAVYSIRPSISSSTDTVSGNVRFGNIRYSIFKPLSINLGYAYKQISRENVENSVRDWDVPEETSESTVSFSARARLPMNLKMKINYRHIDINDPGGNVEPDRSDGGVVSLTWTPITKATAFLSYGTTWEERKDLSNIDVNNKDTSRQKLASSLSYLLKEDLSLTVGYAWFNNNTEQDVLYGDDFQTSPPTPLLDEGVKYEDTADNYSVNISYIPRERIIMSAGGSWTRSSGEFSPDSFNVASLSEIDNTETVYSASGEYGFKNGLNLAVRYTYSDVENSETQSGTAQTVLMTASSKW
jgi:predicted porin